MMNIRTYILSISLFFSLSVLQAQASELPEYAAPRLILKTHLTKVVDLFRPSLPLTIEYNNGGGRSILVRQSYKPPFYNFYFDQQKQNYQIYRLEVELRRSYPINEENNFYLGLANYRSFERFYKENSTYRTGNQIISFDNAKAIISRTGTFLTTGFTFQNSQRVIEFGSGLGIHSIGVTYHDINNPSSFFPFSPNESPFFNAPHTLQGNFLRPYVRIDFAIGLNVLKPKKK